MCFRLSGRDVCFPSGAAASAGRRSHREGGSVGSVGKPVGGESRSWGTFNGCVLQPRLAQLLNKQLIESKLVRADGGGAGFTCLSALSRPLMSTKMMM